MIDRLWMAAVALFLALPLVVVAGVSVNELQSLVFPPEGFSLGWYGQVFTNPEWRAALIHSVVLATLSAALAVLIALPLAWFGWRWIAPWARVFQVLGLAPFLLPRMLPRLRRERPALKLFLREEPSAAAMESLHHGRADCVLLALPYATGEVEKETIELDALFVAFPKGDPRDPPEEVLPERIDENRLLLLEDGHCLKDHALAACNRPELRASATMIGTSLHTLVQMVDNGLGRNPRAWSHGLGLGGVRKRVKQLGGEVEWREVQPHGIGCRVVIRDLSSRA